MAADVTLRDGTTGLIWPLLAQDREALRIAYQRLSPEAKYYRFLSDVENLSEGMLGQLVDSVDGVDHIALVLVAVAPDGRDEIAGVARMVRYPDHPDSADVAVTVGDVWRSRGVATALLAELSRQRPAGVQRIVTYVSTENAPSMKMLSRMGALKVTGIESGVYEVVVELPPLEPEPGAASDDLQLAVAAG